MSAASSRRQLHNELLRLRLDAGLTQTVVAQAHDWSASKVHRIEKGMVSVSKPDLLALLDTYGVTDEAERARLVELARQSRGRGMPFAGYRDVFGPEAIRFFGYESTASWIGELEMLVIPGLLQLPEYTRALIEDGHGVGGKTLERIVESRQERQRLLQRETPPTLSFIIDEAVLSRTIGGAEVMTRQLNHLVELCRRPNVRIQILPLATGAHSGLRGAFVFLRFDHVNDPDVVYMENRRGDSVFENDDEVTSNTLQQFHDLEQRAAPSDQLESYVKRALDKLNT